MKCKVVEDVEVDEEKGGSLGVLVGDDQGVNCIGL